MRMIGYCRASTLDQNLNLQTQALEDAGCSAIFEDLGVSGSLRERKGLNEALTVLKKGDVLVVWRLDRLGRSLSHLIEVVTDLNERGCEFRSLSESLDTTTSGGRLVFHILAALAEFERSLIIERTKAGMAAAKRNGKRFGRPFKLSGAQIRFARQVIGSGEKSIAEMARLYSVDRTTMWRALTREHRPDGPAR